MKKLIMLLVGFIVSAGVAWSDDSKGTDKLTLDSAYYANVKKVVQVDTTNVYWGYEEDDFGNVIVDGYYTLVYWETWVTSSHNDTVDIRVAFQAVDRKGGYIFYHISKIISIPPTMGQRRVCGEFWVPEDLKVRTATAELYLLRIDGWSIHRAWLPSSERVD